MVQAATTPAFLPYGAAPEGNNDFVDTFNADGSEPNQVASFSSQVQMVGWFRG